MQEYTVLDVLFEIIQEFENKKLYAKADRVTKLALDVTGLEDLPGTSGLFGKFQTDFPPEIKKKIKDQLGNATDHIGIKTFDLATTSDRLLIQENLALFYLAPYIRQNTTLLTPSVAYNLPLSAIIKQKINVSERMPGVKLEAPPVDYSNWPNVPPEQEMERDFMEIIMDTTSGSISNKLMDIGIYWADGHPGNYFVNPKKLQKAFHYFYQTLTEQERIDTIRMPHNLIGSEFDLSEGASLFDFGMMEVKESSPPGQKLIELQRLCEQSPDNSMKKTIAYAIEDMLN